MIDRRVAALLLGTVLSSACGSSNRSGTDIISVDGIRQHVTVLAHDSLEGRGTGQPGYDKAAAYVAEQFERYGLAPGMSDGSYLQPVRFRETQLVPGSASVRVTGPRPMTLASGTDFVASSDPRDTVTAFGGPIVFVGYGVSAPEFQYDDYAGVDVKGKVVAVLFGAPPSLPANPRAHFSGAEKTKTAAARGALGVITLWTPDAERTAPWAFMERLSHRSGMVWLAPDGSLPIESSSLLAGLVLSPAASARLFDGASTSWATVLETASQGKPQSVSLPGEIHIRKASTHRDLTAPNVVAKLTGSDPALAEEYVVYTAHLDHDGIGAPLDGDSIYNGAIDNASGIAALLEVARAFAAQKERPKRSILFVATAAEEKGLLGADYYVERPTVPIGSIVANLNMDGNHMLFPTRSIVALGAEHSTLADDAAAAAELAGVELETELMPEQAFFIRSDQYPFVKKGIPALFFVNGTRSSDSTVDGGAVLMNWLGTVYHTPKDDLAQPMHYASGAKYAEVAFRIGDRVANATSRPTWRAGDFFGNRFGTPATKAAAP
ncbi:MAG: M28 family metallopeptidase [Gemmatimonadales bacterium]